MPVSRICDARLVICRQRGKLSGSFELRRGILKKGRHGNYPCNNLNQYMIRTIMMVVYNNFVAKDLSGGAYNNFVVEDLSCVIYDNF